jgi:hypothetical protein
MSEERNETGVGSRAVEMRCEAPTSEPRGPKGLKVASCLGPGDDIAEISRTGW